MTSVWRAAEPADLQSIYEMAKTTGGGFTNVPADRGKLRSKLESAAAAFARGDDRLGEDMFMFLLEDTRTGRAQGTCQIFSQIGSAWPHYSFRTDNFTHYSGELGRSIRVEMLTLVTDHNGCSEVGGLFLRPDVRSSGSGALLARSRYLFIRVHRARFADRTMAQLRGVIDEAGSSPFWDGVVGRFFGMTFREADEYKAVRGLQFIADLMPKHPIYTAMLPESAAAALGVPHPSGRAAQRMLQTEGFVYDRYIDIFDGGPTMTAPTDSIATLRDARDAVVVGIVESVDGGLRVIAAAAISPPSAPPTPPSPRSMAGSGSIARPPIGWV
nr:arginine N-succinyltransferase [Sphingomonas formosensis]